MPPRLNRGSPAPYPSELGRSRIAAVGDPSMVNDRRDDGTLVNRPGNGRTPQDGPDWRPGGSETDAVTLTSLDTRHYRAYRHATTNPR